MNEANLELPYRLKPHLRLDTETGEVVARIDESKLRQIIREEIRTALQEQDQRGLDNLLADISEPANEQEEMAAVLAVMKPEEWEALVQRVKERKATE